LRERHTLVNARPANWNKFVSSYPSADGLQALGYVKVDFLNSEDLLFSITPAGRSALAAIDPEA
jgi:hypothetical protein